MRVLIAHVSYRNRGGEDTVAEREAQLLRRAGADVSTLFIKSQALDEMPLGTRAGVVISQGDHAYGKDAMRDAIEEHRPEIVHAHNLYPLLGPGALREAAAAGCATLHTWHNYRVSCLAGTHLLRGEVCRSCNIRTRGRGVMRGCYRGSRVQSLAFNRGVSEQVRALAVGVPDIVVCLTEFQRRMYIEQGLEAHRLIVKPNSVPRGTPLPWSERDGVVYVGRLSSEKGIVDLLGSWDACAPTIAIIGDGPQDGLVRSAAAGRANVVLRGQLSAQEVGDAIRHARVLAFPSLWYEGLPLTVLEAMAEGTPVVAFGGGAVECVVPGQQPARGDFADLVDRLRSIACCPEPAWQRLSSEILRVFEERYTDERNAEALARIYGHLLGSRH